MTSTVRPAPIACFTKIERPIIHPIFTEKSLLTEQGATAVLRGRARYVRARFLRLPPLEYQLTRMLPGRARLHFADETMPLRVGCRYSSADSRRKIRRAESSATDARTLSPAGYVMS